MLRATHLTGAPFDRLVNRLQQGFADDMLELAGVDGHAVNLEQDLKRAVTASTVGVGLPGFGHGRGFACGGNNCRARVGVSTLSTLLMSQKCTPHRQAREYMLPQPCPEIGHSYR